ncbi:MAG: hypothetical protein NZ744_01190 [Pirellulaceae bacterium]|nr:hypothetical protein [Pirellulaceae bacterium]
MSMYVATKKLWQRGVSAAVLLVLCGIVTQVHAADTELGDVLSEARRRGVSVFVYVYDSI